MLFSPYLVSKRQLNRFFCDIFAKIFGYMEYNVYLRSDFHNNSRYTTYIINKFKGQSK